MEKSEMLALAIKFADNESLKTQGANELLELLLKKEKPKPKKTTKKATTKKTVKKATKTNKELEDLENEANELLDELEKL